VLEERADVTVALPSNFEIIERRESGESQLLFCRFRGTENR
jgi:hypothetical protein